MTRMLTGLSRFTPSCQFCYNPHEFWNPSARIFQAESFRKNLSGRDESLTQSSPFPAPDFDRQDETFARAFAVVREAIEKRSFPAASIAVTRAGQLIALKAFGTFVYPETSAGVPPVSVRGDSDITTATLFDIASVTKVVATTTMAMILYQRGLFDLEAPVAGTVPEFLSAGEVDPRRREVTFRMLLAHSSGLPAYEKLFLRTKTREELLRAVFATPLTADPGSRAEYSDIGFIVLGVALERLAEESLDLFCRREIFGPLAMANTTFNPPAEMRNQIPPTADEREGFRKRLIQGEVYDQNACVLGGVASHAGLFSTAEDLARFAHAMLSRGSTVLSPETIALFTRREFSPAGTSRALGWDTPSSPSQSGNYFGPHAYGHLGYTGTSFWIDPDRQLSITLLTNRTWPDCENRAIKQVRPALHDAIIEALV
jgi:serine-type D-Ala-D-Ala carboxypeptidase